MTENMNSLPETIGALASSATLTEVVNIVRENARALTGADGVTFVMREDKNCYYIDEDAIAPLWKGSRFPLDDCISGWVMLHGQIAVIPDIYADTRVPHSAYNPTFVKSLVMVPVPQHEPIAAIGAYWASRHQPSWNAVRVAGARQCCRSGAQQHDSVRGTQPGPPVGG